MKKPQKKAWILTLSDLITLILCFFVMLFAMSSPKKDGYFQTAVNFEKTPLIPTKDLLKGTGVDLRYLIQILKNQNALPDSITLYSDRLVLNINPESGEKTSRLIQILNNINNQIELRIYSPSNIEEVALKGMSIINTFKNQGLQHQIPLVIEKGKEEKLQIIIFQSERSYEYAY